MMIAWDLVKYLPTINYINLYKAT